MSTISSKYVVLGGGNASGYAAREYVLSGGPKGELLILTEEPVVAYERPALSKGYLLGAARLPGFHTTVGGGGERQTPEWYAEHGITFKTNAKVTAADLKAKTLTLASGDKVTYEKLIIATGARPVYLSDFKTPGADLGGVHYLRSEADAAALVAAIDQAKASGAKVVVIGGGYIGMEVAAGIAHHGVPVTIVLPEDRLLARLLTPVLGAFYETFYAAKGIQLLKGAKVTALQGTDGKVSSVTYTSASGTATTLEAGLVVVGVGARPNTELFAGQLELAAGGIKVDSSFATSVTDVYAVGDVAAFPLLREGGTLLRQEHVTHARSSAAQAVKAILGKSPAPYDYLPYFYSRVFNLAWHFWGKAEGSVVHFGDTASGKFGAYWVHEGKVVGAFIEGSSAEEAAALKATVLKTPVLTGTEAELAAAGLEFAKQHAA